MPPAGAGGYLAAGAGLRLAVVACRWRGGRPFRRVRALSVLSSGRTMIGEAWQA
jgi:hypothetical protein